MCTNSDLKICQYLRFYMKKYFEDFALKYILLFEIFTHEVCKRFIYKHKSL